MKTNEARNITDRLETGYGTMYSVATTLGN